MKKVILFSVICCLISLFSCQNEEVYSCNEEVNEWIHSNLTEIRSMKRSEWKLLNENVKGPVFSAFTPQQKYVFWREKLNEVLKLGWTEKERNHLTNLTDFVNQNERFFDIDNKATDTEMENIYVFLFKWERYAMKELGWNKKIIGSIVATGNKVINTEGGVERSNETEKIVKSSGENCNCNQTYDFCSSSEICRNKICDTQPYCGWFLMSECNGLCEY